MKLTIVIPALNEEEAIGSTIERTIAARDHIIKNSPVTEVEMIVVSDGSTDRTPDIAVTYGDVGLIVFETNRGYGAAIKKGFEVGRGELVSFLDADGTCDPKFFADLCTAIVEDEADVAIGSRLGSESCMPPIRRLGNRIYALILSALSNKVVSDTASGMRVIRRDALSKLYPLPDGLHFTPAMSARVLMDENLTIVERPMRYEERVGESKLHVLRDGLRFFHTIFEMSLMWRPAKIFVSAAFVCLAMMTLLVVSPMETWLRMGRFGEDQIYRLLFCSFLGTVGATLLSAGVVSDHLHRLLGNAGRTRSFVSLVLDRVYTLGGVGIATVVVAPFVMWLIGPGVWTRLTDGYVDLHWSRVVLAGLIAFTLCQMLVTALTANLIRFHIARRTLTSMIASVGVERSSADRTVRRAQMVEVGSANTQVQRATPLDPPLLKGRRKKKRATAG